MKRKTPCDHDNVYPESYFAENNFVFLALHCTDCDEILVIRGDFVNKDQE